MTKFLNDNWMVDNSFAEPKPPEEPWAKKTIADLNLPQAETINVSQSIGTTISLMKKKRI